MLSALSSSAHAQSVNAPSSINGNPDAFETVSGVSVVNLTGTIRVTVSVDSGNVQLGTTSALTAPQGYMASQWTSGNADEISFEGTLTNINNALATLAYRGFGGTMTTSASPAGAAYYAGTGRYYEYVASGDIDWDDARDAAAARTLNGQSGYLATITSEGEMDFIVEKIGGSNPAWISGDDASVEGEWRYSTGPEDDTQFWQGNASGNTVNGAFEDWCSGEPNDSGGNEDYLQITFDTIGGEVSDGCWNDLPNVGASNAQYNPVGYVAEYAAASALVATTNIVDVAPTVLSVTRNAPTGETVNTSTFQSCGTTLTFTVTFSESVSNVDTGDFDLSGAGSTGMSVQSVSASSGTSINVIVTCPGDANRGQVNLVLATGASIIDTNSNALTSTTIGSSEGYNLVDDIRPVLNSVARSNPVGQNVNASNFQSCGMTLTFTATFSESVTGVDENDFAITGSGSTGMSVADVTGSGTGYSVELSCPNDNAVGPVNLVLAAGPSIVDADSNSLTSAGIGSSQNYTLVDNIAPTLETVSRNTPSGEIVPSSAYQSCGTTLIFNAVFSEPVQNVGTADFALTGTGITGMTITGISANAGTSFTVTASCPLDANLGTVGLQLAGSVNIDDANGNALVSTSIASTQSYTLSNRPVLNTVIRVNPATRVIRGSDTQSCLKPQFQADFSKDVRNVDATDFTVSGTAATGVGIDAVAVQSASRYVVTLACLPADNRGTLALALNGGNNIEDLSGLALAGTDIGANQDYEITDAPQLSGITRDAPSERDVPAQNLSDCVTLRFRVSFSEPVQNVDLADFTISGSASQGVSPNALNSVSTGTYTVALSCLPQNARGDIRLELAATASINDALDVPLLMDNLPSGEDYEITEMRVTPDVDPSVDEVIEATAEAPVVAVEKQLTHIKERLSEQRATPSAPEPTPLTPQRPPLTPTRRVEMVATRLNQLTTYFQQTENGNVYFDTDSNALSTAARITLARQAQQLKRYKSAVYLIEGHTDKRGSLNYNTELGTKRAQAVRGYFIEQGIAEERVKIVSFGEERPVSGCADESCFKLNRRAQTRLVINEEIQQEIGAEIDAEYGTPLTLDGQTSRSSCGLIASLSLSNETGTMQDARPVLCDSTQALADGLGYNWGIWTQGLISIGVVQNGSDAPEMEFSGQNLTFGIDYRFPTNTIVGFALGTGENELEGDTASRSDTEQLVASVYMAQPIGDNWALNFAGGHVIAQTVSSRVDTDSNEILTGTRDGISNFGSVELVYYLRRDNAVIDLSAEYMQMRSRFDAYQESGSNALAFAGQEIDNEAISVGGKWNFIPRDSNAAWRYNLTASAQYDLSDASVAKVNFVNIPAANDYLVISKNDEPLTLSLGGGMDWSNARGDSVTLDYNYQQNAELSRIHSFSVTYRKPF